MDLTNSNIMQGIFTILRFITFLLFAITTEKRIVDKLLNRFGGNSYDNKLKVMNCRIQTVEINSTRVKPRE
jgi:hypothetical protein